MDKLGIVFFPEGEVKTFGKYVEADDPNYFKIPGHAKSFKNEIVPSFEFKKYDFIYDNTNDDDAKFYRDAVNLANQGLIIALNKDNSLLVYASSNPTEKQLNAILNNETVKKISDQEVYEFIDEYDFVDYSNMEEYAIAKLEKIHDNKLYTA